MPRAVVYGSSCHVLQLVWLLHLVSVFFYFASFLPASNASIKQLASPSSISGVAIANACRLQMGYLYSTIPIFIFFLFLLLQMLLGGFFGELFSCLSTFDGDSGKEITLKKQESRLDGKEQLMLPRVLVKSVWDCGSLEHAPLIQRRRLILWLLIVAQ